MISKFSNRISVGIVRGPAWMPASGQNNALSLTHEGETPGSKALNNKKYKKNSKSVAKHTKK